MDISRELPKFVCQDMIIDFSNFATLRQASFSQCKVNDGKSSHLLQGGSIETKLSFSILGFASLWIMLAYGVSSFM